MLVGRPSVGAEDASSGARPWIPPSALQGKHGLKSLTLKVSLRTALLRHRMLLATLVLEMSMSGYRIKYPKSSSMTHGSDVQSPSR